MIFGSTGDASVLLRIGRELLQDIIEQEILWYKVDLQATSDNIYGESEDKRFWTPVRLTCLITRGDPKWNKQEYGPDYIRETSFAFYKKDLMDVGYKPEPGDILEWDKNYYEIDATKENQYFVGKDPQYRLDDLDPDRTDKFGMSVSLVCDTHLTRYTRLNLVARN